MKKSVRILNISPKVQQQINDDKLGSYPAILRTGDQRILGNNPIQYDDNDTQVFVEQKINMPFNTTPEVAKLSGFKTGSINIEKSISPASQFLTTFTDEVFEPYKETRNPSGFFATSDEIYEGFSNQLYPGFSTKTNNQICIEIDITPENDTDINKHYDNKDGVDNSGFSYFNFDTKAWEYVGMKDPATGASTNYQNYFGANLKNYGGTIDYLEAVEGQERLVGQFTTSPSVAGLLARLTYFDIKGINSDLENVGYDKIGYPTSFFQAPAAPRYHAKASQGLKLSDFIAHPFALESIEVHLPVKGTRYQGQDVSGFADGFGRDIDNHVFFLYRQNRTNATTDSVSDVSGSIRSLIANQSFCFYNKRTFPSYTGPLGVKFSGPIHENGGEFDYGMLKTNTNTTKELTENLVLKFRPRIYDEQVTAPSMAKIETNTGLSTFFNSGFIKNFWVGGTQIKNQPGVFPTINPLGFRVCDPGVQSVQGFSRLGINSNPVMTFDKFTIDPRTLRSNTNMSYAKDLINPDQLFDLPGGGLNHRKVTSNITNAYRETPVILMPDDELVFGIEAGFYSTIQPNAVPSWNPTDLPDGFGAGSGFPHDVADTINQQNLTLLAQEAKVFLYGTLIKDGKEKIAISNQPLTSNSVHEDIHEVIVDQFQIAQRMEYSGSYLDNYVTGTMGSLTNPRGLVSRATSGNSYDDFALEPFITLKNFAERNEDGHFPPGFSFFSLTPEILLSLSKMSRAYPVATFRYDRFGQYRDMLEQRLDAKHEETIFAVGTYPEPDFIKTFGVSKIGSPVSVLFVSQSSEIPVDPLSTRSCNLSTACTASLPYYDDEIPRNRPDIVFTENPQFSVETIVLNKPSTLLSST